MGAKIVFTALGLLLIVGMLLTYRQTQFESGLLMAIPRNGSTVITPQIIQRSNASYALFTYKSIENTYITAINSLVNVNLIGTNENLPFVLNHSIIHGGFFDSIAVQFRHRLAVLNISAAFDLFGTTETSRNEVLIRGETFLILGVIDDRDENSHNLYFPISHSGDAVNTVVTNLNLLESIDEEHVLSLWGQMGITSDFYHFVNFSSLRHVMFNNLVLAVALTIMYMMIVLLTAAFKAARWQIGNLKLLLQERYLTTSLVSAPMFKLFGIGILFICVLFCAVVVGMDSLDRFVFNFSIYGVLAGVQSLDFAVQLLRMRNMYNASNLLFIGYVGLIVISAAREVVLGRVPTTEMV